MEKNGAISRQTPRWDKEKLAEALPELPGNDREADILEGEKQACDVAADLAKERFLTPDNCEDR